MIRIFCFYIVLYSRLLTFTLCECSYHEEYRVPHAFSDKWESYINNDVEYLIQNIPVSWENAKILCRGYFNGTLAILDTKEKANFFAEALSESRFAIDSIWVGARRLSAQDPEGYRWSNNIELRRTEIDIHNYEQDGHAQRHYPLWQNRTHVPVPDGGADCVALERVNHDKPMFLDLSCALERPFACERDALIVTPIRELKSVRCRTGLYHLFDGRMDWHQAAAHCVLIGMTLANIETRKCLTKLGLSMLKTRPSVETAWIGAQGSLGKWTWVDNGASIFQTTHNHDSDTGSWPPLRDLNNIKQSGCLQLDRHAFQSPVFLEERCEKKTQFICYQSKSLVSGRKSKPSLPSDDNFYYILVQQPMYWQHAYDNCIKMEGILAGPDNADIILQLLLVMGENMDDRNPLKNWGAIQIKLILSAFEEWAPTVSHIWISGRLNVTKDVNKDNIISYLWYNPQNGREIPDSKTTEDKIYVPPWLDNEFTTESPCLNLDRQDHLIGLVYGLPCDTEQYSVCLLAKPIKPQDKNSNRTESSTR